MNNLDLKKRLDVMKQKLDSVKSFDRTWNPQPGDMIGGIIESFGSFVHKEYGKQETVLLRDVENGLITSVLLNDFLLNKMNKYNANVGDLCVIKFYGKVKRPQGFSYNEYKLEIDKIN